MNEQKFLIVVDMQNDFIDGALGTPEAMAILPEAIERIRQARAEGETIIATMDTHGEDYMSTSEGRKLPVKHCIRATDGWQLRPEIHAAMGDDAIVLEKPTFGSVRLPDIIAERLQTGAPVRIELMGLCTDICVASNALLLKAHFPEAEFRVNPALCAGVTPEKHRAALETMASCHIDTAE